MLYKAPTSEAEVIPLMETPLPHEYGKDHHEPANEDSSEAAGEELEIAKLRDLLTSLGNAASNSIAPENKNTGNDEGLARKLDEITIESPEFPEAYSRSVAATIVTAAKEINDRLKYQKETRFGLNEPASPLLIAGKLIAAIEYMQTAEVSRRDDYRHRDDAVSLMGDSWRLSFEKTDESTLDKLRFLIYTHDSSAEVPANLPPQIKDKYVHMSPQVIRNTLEMLREGEMKPEDTEDIDAMMRAHDLLAQVPNPGESNKEYIRRIRRGIRNGGIYFVMPKLACLQDMMYLEANSPLSEMSAEFNDRLYAWFLLKQAASDLDPESALKYGRIPDSMQALTQEDLDHARSGKSHFNLEDVAATIIQKVKSEK